MLRVGRWLADAEVVTYDRRGYAGSSGAPLSATLDGHVEDLLSVLDGRRAVALGHSFGGAVVLAAAASRSDLIPAAVVWEPPQPWRPDRPGATAGAAALAQSDPAEAAELFMRRMVGDELWARLPERTRRLRRSEGPALQADLRALHPGPVWDSAQVSVPVLVGCGDASPDWQRRACADLAAALPAGRLRSVPGAGHGAHLSHPRRLAALLCEAAALGTAASVGATFPS